MGAKFSAASSLVVGRQHRPPPGQAHNLFAIDRSALEVAAFQELVVCPSRHGAHIIRYKDQLCIYKVKAAMVLHEEFVRFNIYEVMPNGTTSRTPVAQIEKARTVLASKRGTYSMLQAWHVAVFKLELRHRTSLLHKKRPRLVATPVEAMALNAHIRVTGKRDMSRGRGGERWDMEFALSDADYRMQIDGQGHASSSRMKCVRVYSGDTLVCAAHTQGFEHLRRASYERPFLGVQMKADLRLDNRLFTGIYEEPLSKPDTHESIAPHNELIPLLLVLAWGEEVIMPPSDQRAEFITRMRSEEAGTDLKSTDIGWDTPLTASAAAPSSQSSKNDKDNEDDKENPERRVGGIAWELEPPLNPVDSLSSHLKNKPSTIKKQNLSDMGSLSLTGI